MLEVILTRLDSIHKNLRTDEVQGKTPNLPKVGQNFILLGEGLNPGTSGRIIRTTPVKEVRLHVEEGSLEFWTSNSHYGLQTIDMDTQKEIH